MTKGRVHRMHRRHQKEFMHLMEHNLVFRVIFGVTAGSLIITTLWTIAYTVIFYTNDRMEVDKYYDEMIIAGYQVESLHKLVQDGHDEALNKLAIMTRQRFVLVDAKGNKEVYGQDVQRFADSITSEEVSQVFQGNQIKQFDRKWLHGPSYAKTGQLITMQTGPVALFSEREKESVYHHYGRQIASIFGGFGLLVLIGVLAVPKDARTKQHQYLMNMIYAMRRIAKGDFTVEINAEKRYLGHFGVLIDGLKDMAQELNVQEQMRQEFISNVSHEIQTPLTSISGFARALRNDQLSHEDRLRYLSIIETESSRLSKISDNLMKLTSLETKQHPFEPRTYRLDHQLRSLILACEPQWQEKSLDMEASLDPVTIRADEDLLSQVWLNLLGNSIKFTPTGGSIVVELREREQEVWVQIRDTGIGMSEEERERVFERFYKADKSRNREKGGSGLGLSIVKKIVEMHGGSISVESRSGEGSLFIVKLRKEL